MEQFIITANVVVPFFLLMGVGWSAVKFRIVDEGCIDGINRLVFFLFLPSNLFGHLYRAELTAAFHLRLVLYCLITILITFFTFWIVSSRFLDKPKLGALVQAGYRSNFVILATPMIVLLMGEAAAPQVVLMVPVFVITYSILAVLLFTVTVERGERSLGQMIPTVLLGVLKNPMIIGILAGLAVNISGLPLPVILEQGTVYMMHATTPVALLGIGGVLSIDKVRRNLKLAVVATLFKNVLMPVIMIVPAVFLGFRGVELAIIAVGSLSPTAVASYAMAKSMGGDGDLAASCLVLTNLMALFTIVLGLTTLGVLNLL